MSSEILRRAAALMREVAKDANRCLASPQCGEPSHRWYHFGEMSERLEDDKGAAYIVSMPPAVALAVADWLDYEAVTYDYNERAWRAGAADPKSQWAERGLTVEGNLEHHHSHALAVARIYLGADA